MGGVLLFGACILGTMYLAASPLFDLFWTEGSGFDKAIAGFFKFSIIAYPLFALSCFFYYDNAIITKVQDGSYKLFAYKTLLGIKFDKRKVDDFNLKNMVIHNWKGKLNTAALSGNKDPVQARYATKGHWILSAPNSSGELLTIEKRAKEDEVFWTKTQIEIYFDEFVEEEEAPPEE